MEDIEDYAGVMDGLRALREQELFLDYTIEVEDQEFKFHKVVLASVSDYFKAMFSGGMMESQTDRVRLEGTSAPAISNLIDFIYNGQFYVGDSEELSLEEVTQCAVYLQIQTAIDACISYAECDGIEDYTCLFERLSTYQTYSMKVGIEKTIELMISNFDELVRDWRPEEMTHHDVKNLIDVWQNSEWDLYLTIKQWVEVDSESRQQHVSDLMNHLRFALMTPEQLEVIKRGDIYSGSDGFWHEEVEKAVEYHSLPVHEKVIDESKQSMVRNESYPFYFNSDGHVLYKLSQETSSWKNPQKRCWKRLYAVDKPEMKHGIETFVVINNFLIVCETLSTDQKWHILDPRTMKWSSMAELTIPRRDSALVSCNKHLYVLGGRPQGTSDPPVPTDSIERYDFKTNTWSVISSKLPVAVYQHGAAVIDDCIYVAGGLVADGRLSLGLDCFDTTTNTWHSKHSLPEDNVYRGLQVMERNNEKVLFIMCVGLYILYYSPSRDNWYERNCANDVCNRHDGKELRWHTNASVLSKDNRLFLLNFCDRRSIGACATWHINPNDKQICEEELEQFPDHPGIGDYHKLFTRLMLLAVPPRPSEQVIKIK